MQKMSSADLLWGYQSLKKKKKKSVSKEYFPMERLISRRTSHLSTRYLVKWKGYSAFFNS
ncbi:unnamed protein product [Porites lobata]|uniref:Chromo domain-containing protein n=1 Tax=Porites lobata TaxID=104759 RepID=A0ABN8Q847_9CNID|nr:unnamed protein product [Porites lobata]